MTHTSARTVKNFHSLKPDRATSQMLLTPLHIRSETSFLQALKAHLNLTRMKRQVLKATFIDFQLNLGYAPNGAQRQPRASTGKGRLEGAWNLYDLA